MSVSSLQQQVVAEAEKLGLTETELKRVLEQLRKPERVRRTFDNWADSKRNKFMVISDTHIGSKYYRPEIMDAAAKVAVKEVVDVVYHAGDVIEGMSNRDGHVYELQDIGVSAQINRAASELEKIVIKNIPLAFTTGNHDEWARNKANQGVEVGPVIQDKVKGTTWLGDYTAKIKLGSAADMWLTHEGASSYALSYSGQKRINGLSGGVKPSLIFNGHIHKSLYMFYRGIHYFEAGCFQDQTPFMAMKGSPAMCGFWVVDVSHNKKGVNEVSQRFYPFY